MPAPEPPSDPAALIPREFHSEYLERPFSHCTRCGESLADMTDGYQVSKHLTNGEAVCEFALCHGCHEGLLREFSPESRTRLDDFHKERVALNAGRLKCAVCLTPRDLLPVPEFSVTGAFRGMDVLHEMMVCSGCRDEMQRLMSEHTRRIWDRFVDENLPGVPADSLTPLELIKL